ncbi:hypothetical protein LSO07_16100 [Janthinobacterium sp. PLB04]|uniref:Uncharacterized protein n=1 Tax=Janthinobacterium lividum TaxID=29581 RepID=A0AAJ4MNQ0_9BURK|nr:MULTISPECIES: hypothetical protein [Janthinobacterium]KAB0325179.1 hypothetical protein F3B38_16000 [Janthinobacterium lividum]QSX94270.1 hypothetical protein J3P46_16085 [Janthinobacterium lividum]UGQ34042.1 hypothetical protein LSO07_16100 [Janthinobacterium sp. PLB04]
MYIQEVEIFSDASNAVVMRHPQRQFPGCLIQGDTLSVLLQSLKVVQSEAACLSDEAAGELADAVDQLSDLMSHYKVTLMSDNISLPFSD